MHSHAACRMRKHADGRKPIHKLFCISYNYDTNKQCNKGLCFDKDAHGTCGNLVCIKNVKAHMLAEGTEYLDLATAAGEDIEAKAAAMAYRDGIKVVVRARIQGKQQAGVMRAKTMLNARLKNTLGTVAQQTQSVQAKQVMEEEEALALQRALISKEVQKLRRCWRLVGARVGTRAMV